ncbi:hypothetical protein [Streptomyces griseosporeus]|uniref:hypothetical protein n=1 Tax=Streptomyces griseosporeus TaxID=1910 RepID=UPI0036F99B1A
MRFRRTLISAAAAGLLATAAAAGTATATAAAASSAGSADGPRLVVDPPQEYYFLAEDGGDNSANRYMTRLTVENRGAAAVENVQAVYDLSSLKDKVTIDRLGWKCTRTDWVVTCPVSPVYDWANPEPFALRSVKGLPLGELGQVHERFTSPDAAPAEHTRRVFNGRPEPRYGTHAPYTIPDSERGSFPKLTPVVGNAGRVAVPDGILLTVQVTDGAFTGERYSNCSYRSYVGSVTVASCRIKGELAPGTAYTTDGAFQGATDPCCRVKGAYYYDFSPLGNPPIGWDEGTPGTGRVLGLKPVDANTARQTRGVMDFISAGDWQTDFAQTPLTLTGKVGQIVEERVPWPRNLGPDDPAELMDDGDWQRFLSRLRVTVTLPEGVSLYPLQPNEQREEDLCDYTQDRRTISCRLHDWSYLRVRFDKKVEGAQGSLTVVYPNDLTDPNPSNNTAPLSVDITGTTPPSTGTTPSPTPSTSATPTPTATATTPAPAPTTSETPPTGSMAATGTSATPLLTTAAVSAIALGATLLTARRRRT